MCVVHGSVTFATAGMRLDKVLTQIIQGMSRTRLQTLIMENCVMVDTHRVHDPAYRVRLGQRLSVVLPKVKPLEVVKPQDIPLSIVYEDNDLLVVNKPAGLPVHISSGHPERTMVNALVAHCGDHLSRIAGMLRPGIVHRLDKDTSGLLVVAKNDAIHMALSQQFSTHSVGRTYETLVWGLLTPRQDTITGNIGRHPVERQKLSVVRTGGKESVTHYQVLEYFGKKVTRLECKPMTGRTHQIRLHLSYRGHPIIGDSMYGRKKKSTQCLSQELEPLVRFPRQALHAKTLCLFHPRHQKKVCFDVSLPADMLTLLQHITSCLAEHTVLS